ncbi:carboxylic acid reductase [Nocardia mexicana]|uniref:Carboxylic acid reductase n=1 Tax=Nocardia mexicana TaxID=279262 RepID=A0A370HAX8_9NOCA|nr:carboxylic acid reductase [Nocardia mexicana]RDI54068.1 fatty acid CoA ligase FadD9 [Nocardia mexicana]
MTSDSGRTERERRIAGILADEQVRATLASESVREALRRPGLHLAQIVETVMTGYADRPALGRRAHELVTDETGRRARRPLPSFDTLTYRELWSRIRAVASAWHHDSERPVRAGDFVCTIGFTSADYAVVDLACVHLGAVSVPLQSSAPVSQWKSVMAETAPRVLATGIETLEHAVTAIVTGTAPQQLIVFDYHPGDDYHREAMESAQRRLAEAGSPVLPESLDGLLERGNAMPPAPLAVPADGDDPLALLIYTSGSTGTPKGAMYTDRLAAAMWLYSNEIPVPGITYNYMPLSHVAGRLLLGGTLTRGGTAYFATSSDMSALFDDLALIRPTELLFVPRVCEMAFQRYHGEVDRRVTAGEDRAAAEQAAGTELRQQVFGGRYLTALCASAPLSAELKTFMESLLGVELHDGYGSTEAGGGVVMDNQIRRPPVLEYRLVDVPELGYFGTDRPYPRGELLLKTVTMFPGYYKRPEITAEMFDADGFYRTGDIVAETGPDRIEFVDRRNNVLKLSQGEFVAVSRLEAAYSTSPLVEQIFVHGSGERAYLLAVIVPTAEALDLPRDDLKTALSDSLQQIARDAEFETYEIPRDFLVETEPFTMHNGLLSGIGKLLRPKLKERYGERLERLYAELAREQAEQLAALRHGSAERPVLDTVSRAAQALLGCSGAALRPDAHFTDLGGDSLSALSLSTLLQEIFAVEVPVGVIVGPATDLARLADYIAAERDSAGRRPTAVAVHGEGARVEAADLTLDRFLDVGILAAAPALPHATEPTRTVLLTGANGYLGRFLCLEWLERLADSGGIVICLVRGGDAEHARSRLDAAFDSGDPELLRRYRELAEGTLEVLAGDIGEPNFGVGEEQWRRLADTVDLIVHPAALVNHVLPYDQLFGPNVVGTAEVIRLALTTRRKPITYLSTVAVADRVDPRIFAEDGDIRDISPRRSVDDGYANGYGNSKWAGEVLLREAHDLCGLPVAVFRSDMILAHSRYSGQLNLPDMFTRLLLSVLATGVAPKSFYEIDVEGNRQRSHYDGLPADFTAAAITALGARITSGFETFDVLNPHDDGLSLDEFVDWLVAAGHPIERIDDYAEWLSRFETALRALPEHQRQQTLLPLLHAFRRPAPPMRGAALPAKKFRAAVQEVLGGDIPHIDRQLIEKYARDLELHRLV